MTQFKLPSKKEQLEQAEFILAQLDLGRLVVEVQDANGVKARYHAANRGAILTRIVTLKHQLGIPTGYHAIRVR